MHSTTTAASFTWNGPICNTCGTRYLGSHTCTTSDLMRRINELQALIKPAQQDRTSGCPCRTGNGGSGVCGCVLSGPRITC